MWTTQSAVSVPKILYGGNEDRNIRAHDEILINQCAGINLRKVSKSKPNSVDSLNIQLYSNDLKKLIPDKTYINFLKLGRAVSMQLFSQDWPF